MPLRIFFSADVHGATRIWRKWIKTIQTHKVDVLMLCGDLSGKTLVPIRKKNGYYVGSYFGKDWRLESDAEILQFEQKLEDIGVYFARMDDEEAIALAANRNKQEKLISDKIIERFDRWLDLLSSAIANSQVQALVMPGNDDTYQMDSLIKQYENDIIFPLDTVVELDGHEVISVAHTNPTPWKTPREVSEKNLKKMIKKLAERLSNPQQAIFNFHVPPHGTRLDIAAEIDRKLRRVIVGGQINMVHVGSKAVRESIEEYQPLLSLHGHIHESYGVEKIGRTLSLNPGSEYSEGVLRGFIIDVSSNQELNYWRVEG